VRGGVRRQDLGVRVGVGLGEHAHAAILDSVLLEIHEAPAVGGPSQVVGEQARVARSEISDGAVHQLCAQEMGGRVEHCLKSALEVGDGDVVGLVLQAGLGFVPEHQGRA